MKFWQRQILLSLGLFCFGVGFFLHSRTQDHTQRLGQHSRDSRALVPPKQELASAGPPRDGGVQDDLRKSYPNPGPSVSGDERSKGTVNQDSKIDSKRNAASSVGAGVGNRTSSSSPRSECPGLLRPDDVQETEVFQKVDGDGSLLEYSAFLDVEMGLVRIVGLSVMRRSVNMFCLLWYRPQERKDSTELRVVEGKLSSLPEHHSRKYSAHYIECPLPDQAYPYAVSMTTEDCRHSKGDDVRKPSNVMPVLRPPSPSVTSSGKDGEGGGGGGEGGRGEGERLRRNFTVCVTALNYRYSRAYELVEMIELNRLLGADLLTFYVNSVGENVEKVLRWYEQQGVVQLLDWKLPMAVDHWPPAKQKPEVHYFAQLASHNDCLNRHRGISRYLVYQDLDEFVIPKKTSTWSQLLDSVKPQGHRPPAFIFRCIFFRKDWPANSENFTGRATADRFRSIVLSTDKREPTSFDFSHRAKYMVDPRAVQTVGIHNIWRYRRHGAGPFNVPGTDALLHHYRSWENPADRLRAVRDTDMYRFKDALLGRLEERWGQLPSVPLDIPLSQYGQV